MTAQVLVLDSAGAIGRLGIAHGRPALNGVSPALAIRGGDGSPMNLPPAMSKVRAREPGTGRNSLIARRRPQSTYDEWLRRGRPRRHRRRSVSPPYDFADQFLNELRASYRAAYRPQCGERLANDAIQDPIWQVRVFGFHSTVSWTWQGYRDRHLEVPMN